MEILRWDNQIVTIDSGELVGYQVDGHEFIHQKGSPGWRSSDTEMFPIIGPVNDANFRVQTPKGNAVQDQHGLLRTLRYDLKKVLETEAIYQKDYRAFTRVPNAKYPEKSSERLLEWPYDFSFKKRFVLSGEGLEITFTVLGEKGMPYMLGYHPAFKLYSNKISVMANGRDVPLNDVLNAGSKAYPILDCDHIRLNDKRPINVFTKGFGHFMLWTEVQNMLCIEPITFYPYSVAQKDIHEGFAALDLNSDIVFSVKVFPENI